MSLINRILDPKFLNFSTILLTAIPLVIPLLPDPKVFDENKLLSEIVSYLLSNKVKITGYLAFSVITLHILDWAYLRNESKKRWLYKFLKHIAVQHLAGCTYPNRITILTKQHGYIVFIKSFWYYVCVNFFNNFKNHCWLDSFKKVAVHLFSDYLTIYVRYSSPKSKLACTYFRISDKASKEVYNGVADKCFHEGLEVNVMTNFINNIELKENLNSFGSSELKKIKKYLRDCYIDERYYNTLKSMQTISNNLYAVPIALDNQKIWGVVIIDNMDKDKRDFKKELEAYMNSYMKIINFSLSAIK